jgi:DNA-binding CsgD family transcriptional regulator
MSSNSELSRWIDYAAEVSRQPISAFPTLSMLSMLSETFEATVGWTWLQADGELGWDVLHPPAAWPPPGAPEVWIANQSEHPLLRWYGRTRTTGPMTIGRVPEAMADRHLVAFARDALGSRDLVQMLSLPVRITGSSHGVFQIYRGGRDFNNDQVALARQLQPLLMLMERQGSLATRLEADLASRFGLTTRESSVLGLLRQGMTMHAMSRQLCCSPRTVEKHLEHLYRKMDVRHRLGAVRAADAHATATTHLVDSHIPADPGEARPAPGVDAGNSRDLISFTGRLLRPAR